MRKINTGITNVYKVIDYIEKCLIENTLRWDGIRDRDPLYVHATILNSIIPTNRNMINAMFLYSNLLGNINVCREVWDQINIPINGTPWSTVLQEYSIYNKILEAKYIHEPSASNAPCRSINDLGQGEY